MILLKIAVVGFQLRQQYENPKKFTDFIAKTFYASTLVNDGVWWMNLVASIWEKITVWLSLIFKANWLTDNHFGMFSKKNF